MSTLTLAYAPSYQPVGNARTATGSSLGLRLWSAELKNFAARTGQLVAKQPASFEERVNAARMQIESAIRRRADYFRDDVLKELILRTRAIFNPEEWEEGEPIPSAGSTSTTLRAVVAIGGKPSLGISQIGNLTATWQSNERSLMLEGLPTGKYKWAYIIEREDNFIVKGLDDSDLSEIREALEA